jgi:gliding motility-associated-like protein
VEYRNGVFLDSITQDLLIRIFDCSQLQKPKVSIPDSINSCSDFTISFPNNSSPLYPGINWNNTTFQWNFGDGDSSSLVYPSHTYADTGAYNARLIIFPGLYCADTTFSKVLVYPFVHADFSYSADTCSGQQIQFTNNSSSTSGPINMTQWTFKKDSSLLFTSSQYNIDYAFTKAPQTYTVSLTVGNTKGCVATDTQFVNIYQSPYPLASHDTLLAKGATLQLQVNDGNYNYNGQYSWWPSEGLSDPSSANPILTSTTDNTYYVSIKNSFGCNLQDSISVKYYSGPDIYVPNAFTPNGDGKNDIFKPVPVGISTFKYFRVYNRYGQLMFQTTTPNQGWDGYLNGSPAPQGTYVWQTAGIDFNGHPINKKGTVILVR